MRKLLQAALFGAAVLATSAILIICLHEAPRTPVAVWKQPSTSDYKSFGPYYLSVIRDDIDWSGFPLYTSRNYSIYVGRDSGTHLWPQREVLFSSLQRIVQ
jgi:hypothetical protein